MDNERPNERTTWSRRLEEPGALPGLTDKEGAWDKLYDRLKEAEAPLRRRRMIWFWAAAACILLIVIPAALLLKDRQDHSSRRDSQKMPVAVNPGSQPDHTAGNSGARPAHPGQDLSAQPVSPNITLSDPSRQGHPAPITHQNPASITQPYPTVHPPLDHAPVIVSNPTQPGRRERSNPNNDPANVHRPDLNKLLARSKDTLTLVFARPNLSKPPVMVAAASKPPKKELRVIHINELQPSQPTPSVVIGPREKPGGLHIRLAPQETFRPSTTYAESEDHSILTFKHAQNP